MNALANLVKAYSGEGLSGGRKKKRASRSKSASGGVAMPSIMDQLSGMGLSGGRRRRVKRRSGGTRSGGAQSGGSAWVDFVKEVHSANPGMSYKDALVASSKLYKKPSVKQLAGLGLSGGRKPRAKPRSKSVAKPKVKVALLKMLEKLM